MKRINNNRFARQRSNKTRDSRAGGPERLSTQPGRQTAWQSRIPDSSQSMSRTRRSARIHLEANRGTVQPGLLYGPPGTSSSARDRIPSRPPVNRRIRSLAPSLVAAALASGLLFWATRTPNFSIRTVIVSGNSLVSTPAILREVGSLRGQNLVGLSTRSIRTRLAVIPAIEDVQLVRHFPHTVVMAIKERQPWVAIQAGDRTFLVDRRLWVLTSVKCAPKGLPVAILSAPRPDQVPVPGTITSYRPLVAALACLRKGEDASYGVPISHVFIDGSRDICLNVIGSGKALLGKPVDLGPKLAMLRTVFRRSPQLLRQATVLDLRNPAAPSYVPRSESDSTAAGTAARNSAMAT